MSNKGVILYEDISTIDGAPIVAIGLFGKSKNGKTGDVVQTFIIRSDIDPRDANKSGLDYSICGDCPHRGIATQDPNKKLAENRTCYVVIGQSVLAVYKAYKRGKYEKLDSASVRQLAKNKVVRLGTYGDPSAVPSYVWDNLLAESKFHLGYTHQWKNSNADVRTDYCMVSADSIEDAREAWNKNMRTFRIVSNVSEVQSNEIICPSTKEGGSKTNCAKCKLCGGTSTKTHKNIAVVVHGSGAKYFN